MISSRIHRDGLAGFPRRGPAGGAVPKARPPGIETLAPARSHDTLGRTLTAGEAKEFGERSGLRVGDSVPGESLQFDGDRGRALLRGVQEGLAIVRRHAGVRNVRVAPCGTAGGARLDVAGGDFSTGSSPRDGTTIRSDIPPLEYADE